MRGALDATLLPEAPAYLDMEDWTPVVILRWIPSASAGPDGISGQWIRDLHEDGLNGLVALLNAADKGRRPTFWSEARLTTIPKDGVDPLDRRPLTICSTTYRLWARRHAAIAAQWLHGWAKPTIVGGRTGYAAQDTTWQLLELVENSTSGRKPPAFLMSLDQRRCFDRVHLSTLREVVHLLRLPGIFSDVLEHYGAVRRHLFIGSAPSCYLLEGPHSCGIPQGCPLACFFANLMAICWCEMAHRADKSAFVRAYLDDRIVASQSEAALEKILIDTKILDRAFGPVINVTKSARAIVAPKGRRWIHCSGSLSELPLVQSMKYLGVDICFTNVVRQRPLRAAAEKRVNDLITRCDFVAALPAFTRPAAAMDGVAALWLGAGTVYNTHQTSRLISAVARALLGKRTPGTVRFWSRGILHLLGVGPHRTHAAAAAIYAFVLQWVRMVDSKRLCVRDWSDTWRNRQVGIGPARMIMAALKHLDIRWSQPTVLEGDFGKFDFLDVLWRPSADEDAPTSVMKKLMLHNLGKFLRNAIAAHEAATRPRDFDGLQKGWRVSDSTRRIYYDAMLRASAPALLTGGVWTAGRAFKAGLLDSPLCPRCGREWKTVRHRLWLCSEGAAARLALERKIGCLVDFLGSLSPSEERCGLFATNKVGSPEVLEVIDYMILQNDAATQAAAAKRKGISFEMKSNPPMWSHLQFAIPPVRKPPRQKSGLTEDEGRIVPVRVPAGRPILEADFVVFTDGSYTPRCDAAPALAGWGFCVLGAVGDRVLDFCGPVVLHDAGGDGIPFRAERLSNNTAELSAIGHALLWLRTMPSSTRVAICSDSCYAIRVTEGKWAIRANFELALEVKHLLRRTRNGIQCDLIHVDAHSGNTWNDRADSLAKIGAECGQPPAGPLLL